jgi:ribosome-associated protein
MDETYEADSKEAAAALELGRMLKEHTGGGVAVIDLRELAVWTDFFIVATVTSGAHLSGLQRRIRDFAAENGLHVPAVPRKAATGSEWDVCDLGGIVVHLMSERARAFYELENLWSGGTLVNL